MNGWGNISVWRLRINLSKFFFGFVSHHHRHRHRSHPCELTRFKILFQFFPIFFKKFKISFFRHTLLNFIQIESYLFFKESIINEEILKIDYVHRSNVFSCLEITFTYTFNFQPFVYPSCAFLKKQQAINSTFLPLFHILMFTKKKISISWSIYFF